MEIAVATLMGLAAVVLLFTHRARADQGVLWTAISIFFAVLLNVDPIYLWFDGVLGGRNVADLISNLLLVVGMAYLSRSVLRALRGPRYNSKTLLAGLGVAMLGLIITFPFIDAPASSTTFMLDFGDQPAAAAYSMIEFGYVGLVMVVTGVACLRHLPEMSRRGFRIGFMLVTLGCACAVLLVIDIFAMDVLHLLGSDLMGVVAIAYSPLYLAAIALLSAGFAMPPLSRYVERRSRTRQLVEANQELQRVWARITGEPWKQEGDLDHAARLHRITVALQDQLAAVPSLRKRLSPGEAGWIQQAEELLFHAPASA